MEYREKRVKTNQIELQIREHGHTGEAIIFLHFSGGNLMMWQRAVPYFQDCYHLYLFDMRGHGKSEAPETGYHMDEMARDVADAMEELGIGRAHVIGSSLGAEVGLSLAANYPDRVISLVCDGALSNEYGPYSTWEGTLTEFEEHVGGFLERIGARQETTYDSIDVLAEKSREVMGDTWNEYIEAMERYGAIKLENDKWVKAFRKPAKLDYFSHYFHYRFEEYYQRIQCPILMIAGDEMFENEPERAAMEGFRGLAKNARIVKISGWENPYCWLMDPKSASEAILKFLEENKETKID